jgi:hypothetical protein
MDKLYKPKKLYKNKSSNKQEQIIQNKSNIKLDENNFPSLIKNDEKKTQTNLNWSSIDFNSDIKIKEKKIIRREILNEESKEESKEESIEESKKESKEESKKEILNEEYKADSKEENKLNQKSKKKEIIEELDDGWAVIKKGSKNIEINNKKKKEIDEDFKKILNSVIDNCNKK